jgi:uncharacterized cupredoxin-like copper-binding protein
MSLRRGALALLLCLALGAAAAGLTAGSAAPAAEATIVVRFSRFQPSAVTVPAGVPVTITLRNEDPIEHEWIIGTDDVHERHRLGTEPYHDQVPTEVTLPALSSRETTIVFEAPGEYAFVCHLPGHEAYGMRGTLRVVARK